MITIGNAIGQTLVFTSEDDLKGVIKHLSGMAEWIEAEGIKPPYVYHQSDDRILCEEIDEYTDWLKKVFTEQ